MRYARSAGDGEAFAAALRQSPPVCVAANTTRIPPSDLGRLLQAEHEAAVAVTWAPAAFRLPATARPGLWWPYQAGLYHILAEASLLPVHLLHPRPGERILDLCAAPGGKAARIAMALDNRGTVIANDRDARRLAAVRDQMKRLGLVNLTTTVHDGTAFPAAAGGFDGVLVDAPCSAEGTNYIDGAAYLDTDPAFRRWIAGQQRALLRRAVALTRAGGRVVYATCSFAPEENEAIVDAILRENGGDLSVQPARIPALSHGRGITHWQGTRFHPGLRHAIRLWPHQSGTGGFFAVVLQRGGEPAPSTAPGPEITDATPAPADMLTDIRERFGLPASAFAGLAFRVKGDHIQAVADDHRPPARPRPSASGVPFVRLGARTAKPTTAGAMLIGRAATRNVVELDRRQMEAYHARYPLQVRNDQLAACTGRGYVLLRHLDQPLGAGFLDPGPPARIDSQFPRIWVPHARRG